jgi:hypothetical protein
VRTKTIAWTLVPALLVAACGGGAGGAADNRTFFERPQYADGAASATQFEVPYPSLDRPAHDELPAFVGTAVFGDTVRFSRPPEWVLRSASDEQPARLIVWVSPKQYQFALYERRDLPSDLSDDALARYEEEVRASGTEIIGQRIPMATANAQGREYLLRKTVPGAKQAYVAWSREYLLRGAGHLYVAQVVTDARSLRSSVHEIDAVIQSIQLR